VLDSDDQDILAGLADVWGEEKATSFFKSLAVNQASLRRGRTLIGQLLAAGEFSCFVSSQHIPISHRERIYRRSGEKAIRDYFNARGHLPYAADAEKNGS
jgi:hypothetical protein